MKTKFFEIRNKKGILLAELKAINSFHAIVKYLNSVFDSGNMLTDESKPIFVDNDLLTDIVDIDGMVNGLYNINKQ